MAAARGKLNPRSGGSALVSRESPTKNPGRGNGRGFSFRDGS